MLSEQKKKRKFLVLLACILIACLSPIYVPATEKKKVASGNFGLPGVIDLPTAKRLPDAELVLTLQNHEYILATGVSFQALPRLGVSFRYAGLGRGGGFAQGRLIWDRSFDAHLSILDEGKYLPAISIGLRDFIGTGWYSSEYIVGTKSMGNLEMTTGIGFGRLAGRNSFSNPLGAFSSGFDQRGQIDFGSGGTLGNINWFQGDAAVFYGMNYYFGEKITVSAEYSSDIMARETSYLNVNSPWNIGISYQFNDYIGLSTQYLYGSQFSVTAHVSVNPSRPPMSGGKELAPVPMRLRGENALPVNKNYKDLIEKVFEADRFEVHYLKFEENAVNIVVTNTKFRSTAQAVGRITSTLQRFSSDKIKFAKISFYSQDLQVATYLVDLEKVTFEQFEPAAPIDKNPSIVAIDGEVLNITKNSPRFTWGVGPYLEHRIFNPDKPFSLETGIEAAAGYLITPGLKISGAFRKSIFTNLTDNQRLDSGSQLPKVSSSWPLYDLEGQSGHIYKLGLSYVKKLAPGLYGRSHAGLLEPFFAGFGGEVLYKPAQWPIGIGVDIHHVRQRDYDMRFDLLDYQTTVGHVSLYYDAGGMFDIELNAGRYLAGDWGATATISRKFGSGWEIGGYATLTDVPFDTFGEGSFDKAVYVSLPIDWIISSPIQSRRRLTLRPITRDGGASLSSARQLYRQIEWSQNASFQREFGRLWK